MAKSPGKVNSGLDIPPRGINERHPMKPTTTWFCDTCHEAIEKPGHGMIEWLSNTDENGKRHGFGLRLVHHCTASPRGPRRCDYTHFAAIRKDRLILHTLPLDYFLDADGVTELLVMLERIVPAGEVISMLQRLHTPGYERARLDADHACAVGIFERSLPDGFYTQAEIGAVLEFARERDEAP